MTLTVTYQSNHKLETPLEACSICFFLLEEGPFAGHMIAEDKGGHFFHESCIQKWMQAASTCPLCRAHFIYPLPISFKKWAINAAAGASAVIVSQYASRFFLKTGGSDPLASITVSSMATVLGTMGNLSTMGPCFHIPMTVGFLEALVLYGKAYYSTASICSSMTLGWGLSALFQKYNPFHIGAMRGAAVAATLTAIPMVVIDFADPCIMSAATAALIAGNISCKIFNLGAFFSKDR